MKTLVITDRETDRHIMRYAGPRGLTPFLAIKELVNVGLGFAYFMEQVDKCQHLNTGVRERIDNSHARSETKYCRACGVWLE